MNWIRAHAKYVTALVGTLAIIGAEIPSSGISHWLPATIAALTALGVYQIPNGGKP